MFRKKHIYLLYYRYKNSVMVNTKIKTDFATPNLMDGYRPITIAPMLFVRGGVAF